MLTGTAPLDALVPNRATLSAFRTAPLTLPGAAVLQLLTEIRIAGRQASLPAGLHPTNPPSAVLQFWSCPESPWGAFRMAQARIGCRSGLRPRGFVQGCVVDSAAAAEGLRSDWGFPAAVGEVTLERGYDRVHATACLSGHLVTDVTGQDPDPLGLGDIAYTTTVALAETPRGTRLVQLDTDFAVSRAERLRPRIGCLSEGWMHPSVTPSSAVSSSIAIADITLQPHRFVSRPEELAFTGTETLR
jgi:hypothetical protein